MRQLFGDHGSPGEPDGRGLGTVARATADSLREWIQTVYRFESPIRIDEVIDLFGKTGVGATTQSVLET